MFSSRFSSTAVQEMGPRRCAQFAQCTVHTVHSSLTCATLPVFPHTNIIFLLRCAPISISLTLNSELAFQISNQTKPLLCIFPPSCVSKWMHVCTSAERNLFGNNHLVAAPALNIHLHTMHYEADLTAVGLHITTSPPLVAC